MKKNTYDLIERKIREGMVEGHMHETLRDCGRLAGGCVASGRITAACCNALGDIAVSLALDKKLALRTWDEAVEYGAKQPAEEAEYGYGAYGEEDRAVERDWNDIRLGDEYRVVSRNWIPAETRHISAPADFDPCRELARYLRALFRKGETAGVCTAVFEKDGRKFPTAGAPLQVDNMLKWLDKGNFGNAVAENIDPETGAWIRINPIDGKGAKDANVTAYRHALVECDKMPVDEQVAICRRLRLPCACIVHSGGKSAHAIVRVDAADAEEYRRRVDYLFEVCRKNGLEVDRQNRNPSRYSRLPGVMRNGKPQFIIDMCENNELRTWDDWYNWMEDAADDLPPIESFADMRRKPPELKEELIEGILRAGHKLRITGPSKAGKSFLLLELALAITEGGSWLGRKCRQGSVLYVNLELDRASCYDRLGKLYAATGTGGGHADMLQMWNLRGRTQPLDKLAPKLIRRCRDMGLAAIIIDPIYKVLTGDENAADDMARFCNFFDRIAAECDCAVIDCHHHSKGEQGGKRAMDRGSGSGVFARDPDALLDMIELDADKARDVARNNAECAAMMDVLEANGLRFQGRIGKDAQCVADRLVNEIEKNCGRAVYEEAREARVRAREPFNSVTAWRIDPTLREFPPFKPIDVWFRYPVHTVDDGLLADASPADMDRPAWKRRTEGKPSKTTLAKNVIFEVFQDSSVQSVTVQEIADRVAETCGDCSRKTVENAVNKKSFHVAEGVIYRGGK